MSISDLERNTQIYLETQKDYFQTKSQRSSSYSGMKRIIKKKEKIVWIEFEMMNEFLGIGINLRILIVSCTPMCI